MPIGVESLPNLSAEVTPKRVYLRRREIMAGMAAAGAASAAGPAQAALAYQPGGSPDGESPTPRRSVTSYNNYYEFGVEKEDPAANAGRLRTDPWTVEFDGQCARPGILSLAELLEGIPLEERVYRHRCVEGWSMVIPWTGVPLARVIALAEPGGLARYVAFRSLHRPEEMPGQRTSTLVWPYREGLRMDEAVHPLAFLAVGLYGERLPNQNGAPIRLVLPWKYGFKSVKAITRITFQENPPSTSWNLQAPGEYGFYANVNPEVDHPRWSQARERRIGEFLKRPTLPFNGYADQVAHLYDGMDLRENF